MSSNIFNRLLPRQLRALAGLLILISLFASSAKSSIQSQNPILSMDLGPDQIGLIKSAPEITTRISFPETVKEIVCGDLYDAASGKGSFVVQRSDRDVFIKPIVPKGISNLFVKTGDKGEHVYNFDLRIVGETEAYRVVNVNLSKAGQASVGGGAADDDARTAAERKASETLTRARQQAEAIIGQAQQQASDIKQQAEARAAETDRKAAEDAGQEIERRFVHAIMLGIDEIRVKEDHSLGKKVPVKIDHHLVKFGDKAYLRYTIQNASNVVFAYKSIELQQNTEKGPQPVQAELVQNKKETSLKSGEVLTGVMVFDPKLLKAPAQLDFVIKSSDNKDLVRISIAE
ncbi:MAG TPA: hypothetical protein VEZ90_13660 [Blastocatellia bacterium]|nr:hypothetical protein [Blastocatellia bacterium]